MLPNENIFFEMTRESGQTHTHTHRYTYRESERMMIMLREEKGMMEMK